MKLQARITNLEKRNNIGKHRMSWGEFLEALDNPESELYKSIEAECQHPIISTS